jgi:hypothetical protein
MMLERLAIYTAVGLVLTTLGLHTTDELFWCMVALLWIAEFLARREGYEDATETAQAIWSASKAALEEAQQLNAQYENKDKQ